MARIRTIKPSFFESEDVSALPLRARLTWIGLWTHCDDEGRTKDNVKLVKARVWPLDPVSLAEVEEDLATLAAHGRIVRYEVDGQRYLEITNWREHQSINRPTPSKIPPPLSTGNGSYPQVKAHAQLSEDSHQEGKGKEGKGREARTGGNDGAGTEPSSTPEPPRQCPDHIGDPDPPKCGACADARRRRDQWDADQARTDAARRSAQARRRAELRQAEIDACHQCDDRGYLPTGRVCHHRPMSTTGAAAARAALTRQET